MFSLNLAILVKKQFNIIVKELKPAIVCIRDQGATTLAARHM